MPTNHAGCGGRLTSGLWTSEKIGRKTIDLLTPHTALKYDTIPFVERNTLIFCRCGWENRLCNVMFRLTRPDRCYRRTVSSHLSNGAFQRICASFLNIINCSKQYLCISIQHDVVHRWYESWDFLPFWPRKKSPVDELGSDRKWMKEKSEEPATKRRTIQWKVAQRAHVCPFLVENLSYVRTVWKWWPGVCLEPPIGRMHSSFHPFARPEKQIHFVNWGRTANNACWFSFP